MALLIEFPDSPDDKLIKFVFDHIRNLFICAMLLTAVGAIIKFRTELPFGVLFNVLIAITLALVALGLLLWNVVHGVKKVVVICKIQSWIPGLIFLPVFSIYMAACSAIISSIQLMKTNTITQYAHPTATPNLPTEKGAP